MKEKSQLEDMRAAIRGDMERARARREADPWRTPEPVERPEPGPDPTEQPLAEQPVIGAPAASEGQTPVGSVPAETAVEPVVEGPVASEETVPEPLVDETSIEAPAASEGQTPVGSVPAESAEGPEATPEPAARAGRGFFSRLFRR